jgi:CheY-like chemotaxis protein
MARWDMARSTQTLKLLLVGAPHRVAARGVDESQREQLDALVSAYPGTELIADSTGMVLYAKPNASVLLADGDSLVGQELQFPGSEGAPSVSVKGPNGVRKCCVNVVRVAWPRSNGRDVPVTCGATTGSDTKNAPTSTPPPRAHAAETLLLVDDDAQVRRATGRLLRGLGYRVVEAENGEEACNLLTAGEERFDLVVTDMFMPRMNGAELERFVQVNHPDLPVLIVTGDADQPSSRPGLRLLCKPFHPKELATTVRGILDRS